MKTQSVSGSGEVRWGPVRSGEFRNRFAGSRKDWGYNFPRTHTRPQCSQSPESRRVLLVAAESVWGTLGRRLPGSLRAGQDERRVQQVSGPGPGLEAQSLRPLRGDDLLFPSPRRAGAPEGSVEAEASPGWYCRSSFFALPSSVTPEGASIGLGLGWLNLAAGAETLVWTSRQAQAPELAYVCAQAFTLSGWSRRLRG